MRDNFPEISRNLPILITVYCLSDDATLPGNFIQQAYFTSNSANFTDIDEEWLLLPSDDFEELDADVSSQFSTLKSGLSGVSPDDVFIVGKGRFVSGALAEPTSRSACMPRPVRKRSRWPSIYGQTSLFTTRTMRSRSISQATMTMWRSSRRSAGSGDADHDADMRRK
ncbi:MAG: CamS family sex pheromone protein [Merdibacter sp.]